MDYSHLRTGFFKGKIVHLNPSLEKLTELLGEEPEKEPTYFWESKGVRKVLFDFYIENPKNEVFKYSMLLQDQDIISSKGTYQYINCVGDLQWANNESQLWDSFTKFEKVTKWNTVSGKWERGAKPLVKEVLADKKYRIAKKGEEDLINIWKLILDINPYNIDTNVLLDLEQFFQGDFSQIKLTIDTYHFVAFAYVNFDFKQKIWKRFLPHHILNEIRTKEFSNENKKIFNAWETQAKDTEFGIHGYYELSPLQIFKEEFIKLDKIISEDGPDY